MPELETARRVVDPSDCDILGHMNVNHYFLFCSDGGFGLQAAFGLDRNDIVKGRQKSFAVVHASSDFFAEVLAGDILYLRSGTLEIGNSSASFRHQLFRASDDKLVFQSVFKTVLMDLTTRRAAAIPDETKSRMQGFLITEDRGKRPGDHSSAR